MRDGNTHAILDFRALNSVQINDVRVDSQEFGSATPGFRALNSVQIRNVRENATARKRIPSTLRSTKQKAAIFPSKGVTSEMQPIKFHHCKRHLFLESSVVFMWINATQQNFTLKLQTLKTSKMRKARAKVISSLWAHHAREYNFPSVKAPDSGKHHSQQANRKSIA